MDEYVKAVIGVVAALGHLPPNLGVFTLRLVAPLMRRLVRFLRLCGNVAPMRLLSPYGRKRKTKAVSIYVA